MADSQRICSVEGCGKPSRSRGWCPLHYKRWKRNGDPLSTQIDVGACSRPCRIAGCGRLIAAKGLCNTHYARWKANPGITDEALVTRVSVEEWINAHKDHSGDECLLWPFSRMRCGYGFARFMGMKTTASRAMCVAAHGHPLDEKLEAAHRCGNGHLGCVNPRHLYWATASQNQMDRVRHGTSNRGGRHPMAKLTPIDVLGIRLMLAGNSQRAVAKAFGVSQTAVYSINAGRSWGHLL